MIPESAVKEAENIIDTSNMVDLLVAGYRTSNRGRPPATTKLRQLLIAIYLTARCQRTAMIVASYRTLTQDIPIDTQVRLGVRDEANPQRLNVTLDDFYNLERTIADRLCWIDTPDSEIPTGDHQRRQKAVEDVCDAVMDIFPTHWDESQTVAIDATGLHAWGRSMPRSVIELLDTLDLSGDNKTDKHARLRAELAELNNDKTDHEVLSEIDSDDAQSNGTEGAGRDRSNGDERTLEACLEGRREWEARWGYKTPKVGAEEQFFGYHEHTTVLATPGHLDAGTVPPLIVRFRLTAANHDIVEPTLNMLDTAPAPITDVLVDRHYHYKEFNRWADQLIKRGITQHLDLRSTELGFTEFDGMRWAAGAAHCPGTPDELGDLSRPPLNATPAEKMRFEAKIKIREAMAMSQHTPPNAAGQQRVKCPALAGKVGCPLRTKTEEVAVKLGLPLIENPPHIDTHPVLPACCTQQTVTTTPPESIRKHQQPHYWGSETWTRHYERRSCVEGTYGNRKNPAAENVDRGQNQVFGLVWLHIIHTLTAASHNARRLITWAQHNPDHPHAQHPIVELNQQPDETLGLVHVTPAEYEQLQQLRNAA